MEEKSQELPPDRATRLIVLVHGIRTRAPWYISVRDTLRSAGFKVELTDYGRFGSLRFLLPVRFFKTWAAARVARDIRAAMAYHKVTTVSIIAHSFGTFIIAEILEKRFDINFGHIIFCGSVVESGFPFERHATRFEGAVVNEVGTHDIWPILADSATWGYGPTGAFGFHRPRTFDRYHRGVTHSAFLNEKFCRRWWIPVLSGSEPKSSDAPENPPLWLRVLSVVHIKHMLLVVLAVFGLATWCRAPQHEVIIPAVDVYFAGEKIGGLVAEAEQPCPGWCPEFLKRERCMRTTKVEGAVDSLVVCQPTPIRFTYRDPTIALEVIADRVIACLTVQGTADRMLRVGVNRALAREMKASDSKLLWLCGCDEEGQRRVKELVDR